MDIFFEGLHLGVVAGDLPDDVVCAILEIVEVEGRVAGRGLPYIRLVDHPLQVAGQVLALDLQLEIGRCLGDDAQIRFLLDGAFDFKFLG